MVINRGAEAPLETALELERKSYAWLRSTHDYAGSDSFLEAPAEYTRPVGHHPRAAGGRGTLTRIPEISGRRGLATASYGREIAVASLADILKGPLHEVRVSARPMLEVGGAHRRSAPPWRGRGNTAPPRRSGTGRDRTPGRALMDDVVHRAAALDHLPTSANFLHRVNHVRIDHGAVLPEALGCRSVAYNSEDSNTRAELARSDPNNCEFILDVGCGARPYRNGFQPVIRRSMGCKMRSIARILSVAASSIDRPDGLECAGAIAPAW